MDSTKKHDIGFPAGDKFIAEMPMSESGRRLGEALRKSVIVLDGAMGTMIQGLSLGEMDFCGDYFAGWDVALKGCNDILCLTAPEKIRKIHSSYLEAGADIIETNSFNANAVSLADYGLSDYVRDINLAAAKVARMAADEAMTITPGRECWVAGSVGPTGKSLSMSQGLDGDAGDGVTWDYLVATYFDQMSALMEGGVDLLQIETVFDGLNAKAAVYAARRAMEAVGKKVPVIVSVTLTESGRTLSGQTLDAFLTSISHADPLAVALNCGFGIDGMVPYIEAMQPWPFPIAVYPNAGLPNQFGEYDETPRAMARKLEPLLRERMLNIVGGCCGTTPLHIKEIARVACENSPREIPEPIAEMRLAGLESVVVSPDRNFMNIGERCNVAGSRKFLRLIKEKKTDEAIEIARAQVEAGAQVIDVNMDDAMLDAPSEMAAFIGRLGVEPDVARVPLMIDSSSWEVVISGLKRVQGKPIVNSISLKEGEEKFLRHALEAREMGAAVVVMAFDERGQADNLDRKIEVCARAYKLLTRIGFPAEDIIFDPNVLAIATGMEAHNRYAVDFLDALSWIKANLPGAKVSGGLSNLSFSFRGNNYVREAMHSVFLYHAISRGMDMAIVNAVAIVPVDDVPEELRRAVDDVLFDRDPCATERLIDIAGRIKAESDNGIGTGGAPEENVSSQTPSERLEIMVRRGVSDGIESLLADVMAELGSAVKVIDGPLMAGMNRVGELFGQGKMFLPQVVKSAHTMKRAVAWLTPYIEEEKASAGVAGSGKMVIATVKGDVHDIGKNIVDVIMKCNGFEMVDLGVMVPGEDIVDRAERENADFVGLSGLITPSLEEMCRVARMMERRGMRIPLMIGGATTSALHTAVKIAPCYGGPVIYTRDAAMMPVVAQRIMNPATRDAALGEVLDEQRRLRSGHELQQSLYPITHARAHAPRLTYDVTSSLVPLHPGLHDIDISVAEARELINWRAFFSAWKLDASLAGVTEIDGCDHCRAQWLAAQPAPKRGAAVEAMQLWKEARRALDYMQRQGVFLRARVIICPAGASGDDIVYEWGGVRHILPTLRQQMIDGDKPRVALADFIAPMESDGLLPDHIGLFAVTTGSVIQEIVDRRKTVGDDYGSLLYQSVADRLVEAATELVHKRVRCELWGYSHEGPDANPRNLLRQYYQGIRPAIGYPSLPDQSLIFDADKLLKCNELGIALTENGAMSPASSTAGYIFAHPDSRYFILGPIGDDQRDDYARRRGVSRSVIDRFLPPQL